MKKVWIRLGGFISADEETMKKIMDGDADALLGAIKENGFEANGGSYIPYSDCDGGDAPEFDLCPFNLVAKSNT